MAHLEATGGLDVLINNAGVQGQGFLEYLDDETFKRVFEMNFFGLVRTTRAALPLLRKSPNARVINVSSLAGLAGYPAGTAYSSSKWAVEGFSESLHYELLPFRIQVCVWRNPEAIRPRFSNRTPSIHALGLMRNPAPLFGHARVMMSAGFIACGACYPFQLSVRCSGARRFLISRK
jgi:NAD(P)-dependent dehydrogenase (short-subunit alcohol dehydrogenase family)